MNTHTGVQAHRDLRVDLDQSWQLAASAAIGWFGVGILGVWDVAADESGDGSPYLLFSIALILSAALTVAAAWSCTRATTRATLRRCGLGAGALAVASTLAAWAGPLWMTMIAISVAVLAVAAPPDMRPGLAGVALGQVVGIAVTFAAIQAEVGRQDGYGDYPTAAGLGVVVAAAGSVIGLALLIRAARSSKSEW